MAIKELDKNTIEQIAAGEVIESPFSIVKELMENSIDAGSKNITVEIKNGGKTYIRVTDDGKGIGKDEIELAFKRHATSKIKDFSDLYKLFTLGFRGEALSSIITCSDLTIVSKTEDQEIGKKLSYKNGNLSNKTSIATNTGTTIEVFDLFKNQPVRRKFLKSDISESNKINKLMYAFAIANPQLSIKYIRDNRVDFHTNNEDLSTIIAKLLDENIKENLINIYFENNLYKVNGFISNSSYYRGNRSMQYLYVNRRYVHNDSITKSIEREYRSLIPNARFPAFFIFIETASKNIDVNIHPNKKEIKFVYEEPLLDLLTDNISRILYDNKSIRNIQKKDEKKEELNFYDDYERVINSYNNLISENEESYKIEEKKTLEDDFFVNFRPDENNIKSEPLIEKEENLYTSHNFLEDTDHLNENNNQDYKNKEDFKGIIYKNSIFNRYSIFEKKDKLLILDHRRADEAISFSKFIEEFEHREVSSQKLLEPIILKLDSNTFRSFLEKENTFIELGFDIEKFGDRKIIIRYVPFIFDNPENLDYFYELLDMDFNSNKESLYKKISKLVSRSSFRKGHRINKEEAEFLIEKLEELDNPYKNYEGKNTVVIIKESELEKYFDR